MNIERFVSIIILAVVVGFFGYQCQRQKEQKADEEKYKAAVSDSLKTLQAKLKTSITANEAVDQENQRVQDTRAGWEPLARLVAQSMTANAQRIDVLENLIRSGQIKAADTIDRKAVVSYNAKENESLVVALRLCDSIRVADKSQRAKLAVAELVKDTLSKERDWGDRIEYTANIKGLFTGKNKALKRLAKERPFKP